MPSKSYPHEAPSLDLVKGETIREKLDWLLDWKNELRVKVYAGRMPYDEWQSLDSEVDGFLAVVSSHLPGE